MQKLPERIVEPTVDCPTEGTTRPVRVPRDRRWGSALPFVLASLACCARTPDETAVVGRRSLTYTYTMRVKAFTEKAEQISNPVSWLPISYIVEDGAKVEEGQVIVRFNNENSLFELGALERNRDVIDAELAHRLAEIANREREMQDRLNTLRDQLAVLEARLARLQSAPLADDVRIAEGRLRVARLNQQAAEKDLAKARDRFSRQMISRAELDRHESELREKEATLTYARNELAYTKLPTAPGTIEQTELDIENARLECGKLENELAEHQAISEIQKKGARARKGVIERKIEEQKEDISNTVIKAPISGYVSYGKLWEGQEIGIGTKMWKNYNFMRIPDMRTLALRGTLHESVRKYFSEGDAVTIRLRGKADHPVRGTVKSISTLSHDLAEKEESHWGGAREFGVKVFDVIVDVTEDGDWVRPGMVGSAEISASAPLAGPAVPLKFVMIRDGVNYLSADGVFEEVQGTVVGGWFMPDDATWEGKVVHMRGEFKDDGERAAGEEHKKLFSASGELLPVNSTDVRVSDIGHWWPWPKVTWLVDEETEVTPGDKVATLETKEVDRRISEEEARVNEVRSRKQELGKQLELTRREGQFRLKMEQNLLRIAELKMDTALHGRDAMAVFRAELAREQARIRLDAVTRRLAREEAKSRPTLSQVELARLKREKRRLDLGLEEAEVRLRQAMAGADRVTRSAARLAYLRQNVKVDTMRKGTEFDDYRQKRNYERAKLDLKRSEGRLAELKDRKANHEVKSPAAGIICYGRVWNDGAFSKVATGSQVGPRFTIMSIPDLTEMYVRVEVPEKCFSQVQVGLPVDVQIPSVSETMLKGEISGIDLLFENKEKKDSQVGLYTSHEPLGEVVFNVRVTVRAEVVTLKPGLVAEVYFPFVRL